MRMCTGTINIQGHDDKQQHNEFTINWLSLLSSEQLYPKFLVHILFVFFQSDDIPSRQDRFVMF